MEFIYLEEDVLYRIGSLEKTHLFNPLLIFVLYRIGSLEKVFYYLIYHAHVLYRIGSLETKNC